VGTHNQCQVYRLLLYMALNQLKVAHLLNASLYNSVALVGERTISTERASLYTVSNKDKSLERVWHKTMHWPAERGWQPINRPPGGTAFVGFTQLSVEIRYPPYMKYSSSIPNLEGGIPRIAIPYRLFQKELNNFESLYKFIQRACTVLWTVIMWQDTPSFA
jgi:hypothetical protein